MARAIWAETTLECNGACGSIMLGLGSQRPFKAPFQFLMSSAGQAPLFETSGLLPAIAARHANASDRYALDLHRAPVSDAQALSCSYLVSLKPPFLQVTLCICAVGTAISAVRQIEARRATAGVSAGGAEGLSKLCYVWQCAGA